MGSWWWLLGRVFDFDWYIWLFGDGWGCLVGG